MGKYDGGRGTSTALIYRITTPNHFWTLLCAIDYFTVCCVKLSEVEPFEIDISYYVFIFYFLHLTEQCLLLHLLQHYRPPRVSRFPSMTNAKRQSHCQVR